MTSRLRVWGLTAAAVVVVVLLGFGAYLLGAGRTPPQVGGGPVAGPSSPTVVPVPVTPTTDPLRSATVWLRGYRTQSWTDPQPWSWTVRVAPVVTGELAGQYRTVQSAAGGAEWADYVARRCATQVSGLGAVVPAEAPRSDTEVYVQVTGDAVTQCGTGPAPGGGTEHLAATVELVRGGDGLWRVTNRLY
jgi:hypothetical protein